MYIQHNMMAAEANRFLKTNGRVKKKSTEKLSSGYRINRAADDAAGLTISEKMRGQIRGLNQASENIQDGISLIQTAEGALQETQAILQRMRELSVQAANDTYVTADREAIQLEMDALTEEVDRIAKHTEFNNGIYPLLGGAVEEVGGNLVYDLSKYLTQLTITFIAPRDLTLDGVDYKQGDSVTATAVAFRVTEDGYSSTLCDFLYGVTTSGSSHALTDDALIQDYNQERIDEIFQIYSGACYSVTLEDYGADEQGRIYYQPKGSNVKKYIGRAGGIPGGRRFLEYTTDVNDPSIIKTSVRKVGTSTIDGSSSLWTQAGANATQGINLSLVDGTAEGLGLTEVSMLSTTEAGDAIQTVDDALNQVSRYRSDFGAQQNRLEHAMAVDDNTAENLQAAESRIRDLDMADEVVTNAKSAIMEQSMQAMLANANRQTEGVLALLQR